MARPPGCKSAKRFLFRPRAAFHLEALAVALEPAVPLVSGSRATERSTLVCSAGLMRMQTL